MASPAILVAKPLEETPSSFDLSRRESLVAFMTKGIQARWGIRWLNQHRDDKIKVTTQFWHLDESWRDVSLSEAFNLEFAMSRLVNWKFEPLSLLLLLSPLWPPNDRNPIPQNTLIFRNQAIFDAKEDEWWQKLINWHHQMIKRHFKEIFFVMLLEQLASYFVCKRYHAINDP